MNPSKSNITYIYQTPYGSYVVFDSKPDLNFIKVNQIHSNINLFINDISLESKADGIISNNKTPLCIVTADCLPVLIIGKKGHAMLHAGWKGLQSEIILQNNIKDIEPIYAFIGPHISQENYEVSEDFRLNFLKYSESFNQTNGKTFFNLSKVCISQLKLLNSNIIIENSLTCTFSNPRLHSYRQDKTTNRNWNIFIPN